MEDRRSQKNDNSLEGHRLSDPRTEFAQKQRSISEHSEEDCEPSSEDPQRPPQEMTAHANQIFTYVNKFLEISCLCIAILGNPMYDYIVYIL